VEGRGNLNDDGTYRRTALETLLAMFRSLVNLTSIKINNSRGCFLDLLATIASSSPLIEVIDFHDSHWTQRDDNRFRRAGRVSFKERYAPACSKAEVDTILGRFRSLRQIDLGILPTFKPQRFEGLGSDLARQGVIVNWDFCTRFRDPQKTQ